MSTEAKTVVRRFLEEIFTGGNLDLVDELFAPDYILHDPTVPFEVRGPEGMKQYVAMYRAAYPDTHFTIEDQIAEGDEVVTRWTGRGTHQGELMGVAPTGQAVTVAGIEIDRVSGGKMEETWVSYDALGMMQQLGVIPAPEEAVGESNIADQGAAHVSLGEGKSLWLATDLFTFKAVGEMTDGAFALAELTAQPGFGPPPHIHHREDEGFYILEGEFEFLDEGRTFTAGAGSFVYLPKGRLHMHRAAGDAPARALVLNVPAGIEKFIEEAGEPATDRSSLPAPPELPELERIVAIAQEYGIEVPPPPAQ